jgi:hypothetical protein
MGRMMERGKWKFEARIRTQMWTTQSTVDCRVCLDGNTPLRGDWLGTPPEVAALHGTRAVTSGMELCPFCDPPDPYLYDRFCPKGLLRTSTLWCCARLRLERTKYNGSVLRQPEA